MPTARVALGRRLFFDPQLSRNGQVSCATCHQPEHAFTNGERFASGVTGRPTQRNVPGLINSADYTSLFWDGRVASLEEQALIPIQHSDEMGMSLPNLVQRLSDDDAYERQFREAFGGGVDASRIAAALAAFQRTLLSHDTPYDRFVRGQRDALSPAARRGMALFFGQAGCAQCHPAPALTDNAFHNVGVFDPDLPTDHGRFNVTGRPADRGAFRTPALREVARTEPYMHNGQFKTLKAVVEHYNFGGVSDRDNPNRDELLEVLYLTERQVDDLVTFLTEGLTSDQHGF